MALLCSMGCRLLQPSPVLSAASSCGAATSGIAIDCLLLDFDSGLLTSVRHLLAGDT